MIIGISGKLKSGKNTVASIIQYLMVLNRPSTSGWTTYDLIKRLNNKEDMSYLNVYGWPQKAFAHKLKEVIALLLGIPVSKLYEETFKDEILPDRWKRYKLKDRFGTKLFFNDYQEAVEYETAATQDHPYTREGYELQNVREFMQLIGTELFREQVHPNVWVNALLSEYVPVDDSKRASMGNVIDYSACTWPNWIINDVRFPNEAKAIKARNGLILRINRPADRTEGYHNHPSETALDNWKFDHVIENDKRIEELVYKTELFLERQNLYNGY